MQSCFDLALAVGWFTTNPHWDIAAVGLSLVLSMASLFLSWGGLMLWLLLMWKAYLCQPFSRQVVVGLRGQQAGDGLKVKLFRLIIGALLFASSLPVLSLMLAATLSKLLGCTLNEADVHPCYVLGISIGPLLYALSVAGWLMILSLPLGAVASLTWIGAESVWFVRKRMVRQ